MDEILKQSLLYDFYGELLTAHQKEIYEEVVLDDCSLSEVAESHGISRQGVRDNLKRAEAILYDTEERLGLVKRFLGIKKKLSQIDEIIAEIEASPESRELSVKIKKQINSILTIVGEINDGEK